MTDITFHIHVDPDTQLATATITPPNAKFNEGDEVRFESDYIGTVIVCRDASPFRDLAPEEEVQVPANGPTNPYILLDIRAYPKCFHFACGKYEDAVSVSGVGASGKRVFRPWLGGANTPHPPIGT